MKKTFQFDPLPLTAKRKIEWNAWITEKFSKHSRSFCSWPGLHELYARSVTEPISYTDFEALPKEHPILKLVARDELLQGYTLDQDYMAWLKMNREAKWKKLSKKTTVPSKKVSSKAALKSKEECSVSSMSLGSNGQASDFDSGFDDFHYDSAPPATAKLAKHKLPSVTSVSVRSDDQSELRSLVMDMINETRAEEKKQLRRFEQQLGGFQDQLGALGTKVNNIEGKLGEWKDEIKDEIKRDQAGLKEFLVESFANINNSNAAQQKAENQAREETRGGAPSGAYPHYYMASPAQHPAMTTPGSVPSGFMPPPQG